MSYKTYGGYLPNLTRQGGSVLADWLDRTENEKGNLDRHNGQNPGCPDEITTFIS